MKNLTYKFLPSKKNIVNGNAPITLRITMDRKSTYISLGKTYSIPIKDWDLKKEQPKRNISNELLIYNLDKLELIVKHELLKISSKIDEYNLHEIKDLINSRLLNMDESVDSIIDNTEIEVDFLSYFKIQNEKKREMGKFGTFDNYNKIYSNVAKFLDNKKVPLTHINVKFLEKYQSYLIKTLNNKKNSRHNNFKVIRAVLNKAIAEGLLPVDKYPFRIFKLETENTKRVFLTIEELRQIENLELKQNSTLFHNRNMFVFACYTGFRISDILTLKWENIVDNKVYIRMRKTESPISIKLIDKAKEILNIYSCDGSEKDKYIFPPLQKKDFNPNDMISYGKRISAATAYINKTLYEISEKLELNKKLHFHTSRHTFATLLLNNEIPIHIVKDLLGHSKIQTTMIYTHMTNQQMDKEMDKFNLAIA
ncbi:MAG: tyrosine-type recombinase/integrase [Bacteroidales bacterium]